MKIRYLKFVIGASVIGKLFWVFSGSVFYTYIGYPLMLALLGRIRSRPIRLEPLTPTVTLLIAAHNEQAIIARKIENSLALDYTPDRLQILIAADGSDDKTADIVRSYAGQRVELSYSPLRRGKMAAINRAMAQVRGEIVLFSDANNMYEANVLRELVSPFADSSVGAVTGAKSIVRGDGVLGESEGLYWKYESFIKSQETKLGSCSGVAGEILAVRRDLFEPPPDDVINDDFFMAIRIIQRGYRVVYTPRARSWEHVSLSAQDEITRRARIVAGRYQAISLASRLLPWRQPLVVWQIVSHKFLRPLVPFAMLGAFLTNLMAVIRPARSKESPLLALTPPINWIVFAFQLLFYGLAWLGNKQTDREGLGGKLLYLPAFLVNSNLAAIIGLYRFVRRSQTPLWQRVQRRPSSWGQDQAR